MDGSYRINRAPIALALDQLKKFMADDMAIDYAMRGGLIEIQQLGIAAADLGILAGEPVAEDQRTHYNAIIATIWPTLRRTKAHCLIEMEGSLLSPTSLTRKEQCRRIVALVDTLGNSAGIDPAIPPEDAPKGHYAHAAFRSR